MFLIKIKKRIIYYAIISLTLFHIFDCTGFLRNSLIPLSLGVHAIGSAAYREDIAQSKIMLWLAGKTNTNPKDLALVFTYTFLYTTLMVIQKNKFLKKYFLASALLPPVAAIIIPNNQWNTLTKNKLALCYYKFWSALKHLPGIGNFFACPEPLCPGICDQCKIQRLYQTMPLGLLALYVGQRLYKQLFPTSFERQASVLPTANEECCICLEKYIEAIIPVQLKPCKHHMCVNCAKYYYFNEDATTCPLCRKPININDLQKDIFV